jgi:type IV pilus assembly protein PilA
MKKMLKIGGSPKGFTLIEILVVIGIIAILAAIVLIAINPARQFAQGRQTQRTSNVNAILNAVGQFIADNQGDLPSEIDGSSGVLAISDGASDADLCDVDNLVPTYIPSMPTDPASAHEGAGLTNDDCDDGYDTGYTVEVDTDGRVTVCAPEAANEDALEDAEAICVTR